MNKRQVIILWIIALVLGIAVAAVKLGRSQAGSGSTHRSSGELLFESFPAGDVASIELKGASDATTLDLKDGVWTVAQRDAYPANRSAVNELLRTLAELKVTQGIEAGPSFAPRFGMDESASTAEEHGLLATFKDASGKEIAKVTLGKNTGGESGPVSGRYIRNHADESGFYATNEMFSSVSDDPKRWISDEFIKVERIKSITLSEPDSDTPAWSASRKAFEDEFTLDGLAEGESTDPASVNQFNSLFSFSRFEDVVPAGQVEARAESGQTRHLTIDTFDGITYNITFTPAKPAEEAPEEDPEAPPGETYFFTVELTGEPLKEREKGEDETPEDAKTKDEAFASRLETLTQKIEREKTFAGRTFEVSKYTLDPVLKDRAALVKKDEAAASPQPAQGSVTAVTPPLSVPPLDQQEEEAGDSGDGE